MRGERYTICWITPTILVEDFYNTLEAEKGKKIVIFENSVHFLIKEEKEK
ncbi:MAG: hypothetical protein ACFFFB_20115 [Candidatus Heimdallarchaeota archaeon]